MMATPLGPRLLGVPESAIERCRLGDLLGTMQQYNREQAVLAACFGPPPPLSAQAQAAAAGVLALTQGEAAGAEKEEAAQTASTSTSTSANDDGAAASAAPAADDPAASAAAAQRRAASVLHYSRQLAAAALVLGLGAKTAAEDPGVAGASLGRLLAKSFMAQAPAVVGAIKHSRLQVCLLTPAGLLLPGCYLTVLHLCSSAQHLASFLTLPLLTRPPTQPPNHPPPAGHALADGCTAAGAA